MILGGVTTDDGDHGVYYDRGNTRTADFPADIDEIDLTEKEHAIREMLTPSHGWARKRNVAGWSDTFCNTDLPERQRLISDWCQDQHVDMNSLWAVYFKNWTDQKPDDADWKRDCRAALVNLVSSGTYEDAQIAPLALTMLHAQGTRAGRSGMRVLRMVEAITGDGFASTEISFRNLSSHSIDYGDKVIIGDVVKRKSTLATNSNRINAPTCICLLQ